MYCTYPDCLRKKLILAQGVVYRKEKKLQKNNFQLHAFCKNDIHKKSSRKKPFLVPTPPSDLNTLVLHGASRLFVASLASLLDASNKMPIKCTQVCEVVPVKPRLSQKPLVVPLIRIRGKLGCRELCCPLSAPTLRPESEVGPVKPWISQKSLVVPLIRRSVTLQYPS